MFHHSDNSNEVSCRVCVIDLVPCARYVLLYSDCFVVLFDPPLSWKVPEDREDVRTEGRQRFIRSHGESTVLFGLFLKDTCSSISQHKQNCFCRRHSWRSRVVFYFEVCFSHKPTYELFLWSLSPVVVYQIIRCVCLNQALVLLQYIAQAQGFEQTFNQG